MTDCEDSASANNEIKIYITKRHPINFGFFTIDHKLSLNCPNSLKAQIKGTLNIDLF